MPTSANHPYLSGIRFGVLLCVWSSDLDSNSSKSSSQGGLRRLVTHSGCDGHKANFECEWRIRGLVFGLWNPWNGANGASRCRVYKIHQEARQVDNSRPVSRRGRRCCPSPRLQDISTSRPVAHRSCASAYSCVSTDRSLAVLHSALQVVETCQAVWTLQHFPKVRRLQSCGSYHSFSISKFPFKMIRMLYYAVQITVKDRSPVRLWNQARRSWPRVRSHWVPMKPFPDVGTKCGLSTRNPCKIHPTAHQLGRRQTCQKSPAGCLCFCGICSPPGARICVVRLASSKVHPARELRGFGRVGYSTRQGRVPAVGMRLHSRPTEQTSLYTVVLGGPQRAISKGVACGPDGARVLPVLASKLFRGGSCVGNLQRPRTFGLRPMVIWATSHLR